MINILQSVVQILFKLASWSIWLILFPQLFHTIVKHKDRLWAINYPKSNHAQVYCEMYDLCVVIVMSC